MKFHPALIQQDADRMLPAALEQIHPAHTMFGLAPAGLTTISLRVRTFESGAIPHQPLLVF